MRAVVQRVSRATVTVDGVVTGAIGRGLLVLLGVAADDTDDDIAWLAGKVVQQRLFEDADGKMNRSVVEVAGGILVVSQFTLLASTRKGTKPSWHRAAPPEMARPLYGEFLARLAVLSGSPPSAGVFGAMMDVESLNAGPVTLLLDSRLRE